MKWFGKSSKSAKDEAAEARKFERIEFFQSSFYTDKEITHECWFNNISLGGLCFDTNSGDLSLEDTIKILYKIGIKIRNDMCVLRYKTKALNNWRYGCEFITPDEQRDEMIRMYVQEHVLKAN